RKIILYLYSCIRLFLGEIMKQVTSRDYDDTYTVYFPKVFFLNELKIILCFFSKKNDLPLFSVFRTSTAKSGYLSSSSLITETKRDILINPFISLRFSIYIMF
ncbi:hypothetical protein ACJX0J_034678, partial [Zea mays]